MEEFYGTDSGYRALGAAWSEDEFALDPTRVTVHVGHTGMDGDTLRKHLMDSYDIQINKTSRNTLLFMLNIGTTRGAIAYLLEVLTQIARELEEKLESESEMEKTVDHDRVISLTEELPPLPDFSRFHDRFSDGSGTPDGDLRAAFFLGRNDDFLRFSEARRVGTEGDGIRTRGRVRAAS